MTTIAYRNGVMAGDTRTNYAGTICPGHAQKVFKFQNGAIFGAAGAVDEIQQLLDATEQKHPVPKLENVEALLVPPDGSIFSYEGSVWTLVEEAPYTAIGSGWVPAIVAMRYGASAAEVVRTSMEFDMATGGEVRTVQLDPPRPKSKSKPKKKRTRSRG